MNHPTDTDATPPPRAGHTAPQAIILAAGKGTRMGGDQPKVVSTAGGQPLIHWVVRACFDAGVSRCIVVVGYGADQVKRVLTDQPACVFVEQTEQRGTGHATQMAAPLFEGAPPSDVLVLPGDAPLITTHTLATLIATHRDAQATATLATAILDEPEGYGRVIRASDGTFDAIVEQKDTTGQQADVREINTGYYCFRSDRLFESLSRVGNTNAQGEYYLTDVPGLLRREGQKVAVVAAVAPEEVLGVNTPQHLAVVDGILRTRASQEPPQHSQTKESA